MSNAETQVRRFLKALEAHDLHDAAACLAPDLQMVLPVGAVLTSLDQMVDQARSQYRRVAKTIDLRDTGIAVDGKIMVFQGTLHEVWPDGRPFDGIRLQTDS